MSLLSRFRERLGLSQERLASILGLSTSGLKLRERDARQRQQDGLAPETALACGFVAERYAEGQGLDSASLAKVAIEAILGQTNSRQAAIYSGRLQAILRLLNTTRSGRDHTSSMIAEAMGLTHAGELHDYFTGASEPSFAFLDQFSEFIGCTPDWLKHGYGNPFSVMPRCNDAWGFYSMAIEHPRFKMSNSRWTFIRSRHEHGNVCIVVRVDEFLHLTSPSICHLSSHVGAGGQQQICSFHEMLVDLRSKSPMSVLSKHVDDGTFRKLVGGEIYPASVVSNLNIHADPWADDFLDLTLDERRISGYGSEFPSAVHTVLFHRERRRRLDSEKSVDY